MYYQYINYSFNKIDCNEPECIGELFEEFYPKWRRMSPQEFKDWRLSNQELWLTFSRESEKHYIINDKDEIGLIYKIVNNNNGLKVTVKTIR